MDALGGPAGVCPAFQLTLRLWCVRLSAHRVRIINPPKTVFVIYKGIFSHENLPQTAWSFPLDSLQESPISLLALVQPSTTHTPFSIKAPRTAPPDTRRRGGPHCSGAEGKQGGAPAALDFTPCARVRRATGTRSTHLALAHTGTRALPPPLPPPVPGSPKLPPRLPGRRVHAAPRGSRSVPAVVLTASNAAPREGSGARQSPPPEKPGVRAPGCTPGAGAVVALAAPGRALPSLERRPPGCSQSSGQRKPEEAGARAPPGQRAAGTGSHGAQTRSGPRTRPRPPGGPSHGLCVSASTAASRAGGQ